MVHLLIQLLTFVICVKEDTNAFINTWHLGFGSASVEVRGISFSSEVCLLALAGGVRGQAQDGQVPARHCRGGRERAEYAQVIIRPHHRRSEQILRDSGLLIVCVGVLGGNERPRPRDRDSVGPPALSSGVASEQA